MAKKKTQSAFFCQSCGTQSPKWLGKCPQCNEWNTFVEEIISKESDVKGGFKINKVNKPVLIRQIDYGNEERIVTNDNELNRVLGGGLSLDHLFYWEVILELANQLCCCNLH